MTESEATKYGEDYLNDLCCAACKVADKHKDFVRMAIKALEEIQKYREIGTVEELKTMKEHGGFTGIELAEISAALCSLGEYRTIGTVEECRAAVEKQKPKKVNLRHIRKYDLYDDGECPCCGTYAENDAYCPVCGQKLDWSYEE